ncbi:FxsA family protein [Thiomicrorhabdus sp. ZW0627]|uniref:FxsA family protein n=1 Tax=Thiomicrorhabdus sp. ZW0627 TaxID=3039774 RepID=UPI0024367D53|nr:FxsA family protein [Thiomicrorhabdus sp. ZW0627]MDG6774886.1 FxsA family protein [Thiomicrorhabdus sp. ZW0627]
MLKVFLLFFVLVPLAELYILIQVGSVIGALPTVLLTVATAVMGVMLMRSQGASILQKTQVSLAKGEVPQSAMMEGAFIFLGGLLLLVPGLMSDALGLLFLIPWVRKALIRQTLKGYKVRGHYQYRNSEGDYFEGEWTESGPKQTGSLRNHSERDVIEGEVLDDKESPRK